MDGYPNEDEEFELMYGDELELMREQDFDIPVIPPKSRKTLDFSLPKSKPTLDTSIVATTNKASSIHSNTKKTSDKENLFEDDFVPIEDVEQFIADNQGMENESNTNVYEDGNIQTSNNANKRTVQHLFGDITDILSEDMNLPKPKKLKLDKTRNIDQELALIEHIIEMRKMNKERNSSTYVSNDSMKLREYRLRDNLSYRLPKYPFIKLTRPDGEQVYVRCHSEEYEAEDMKRIIGNHNFIGVMGGTFKDIWKEASNILEKERMVELSQFNADVTIPKPSVDDSALWVDLYKPRKYVELLSDESTNRTLLRWIKLWDKVVFNRRPKIKPIKVDDTSKFSKYKKQELSLELDEHGRPQYKVALLCGPPGLGKTTLAHMVAKHAGYNVVEINASDDRSTDCFKKALENATTMRSVLDDEKRPNCIVFDEIDGAPITSIDFLIKFVQGTHITKTKKGKAQKPTILKRPIICICNDVYVPALRSLRQIAFVVNFPPTASARLAERLFEISNKQHIRTDLGALLALSEKSNNDIRSCLSILHFFKAQKSAVTLSDVMKTSVGQKDMQKGLFAVWTDIFQIERPKKGATDPKANKIEGNKGTTLKSRAKKVLSTVASFGDYERVAQGVFENYPSMHVKDSSLREISDAMDWFCFSDLVQTKILTLQNYSLSSYLQYGFVKWHFVFAGFQWQKITYPSVGYEMRTKTTKQKSLMQEVLKGMQPVSRAYASKSNLQMEILPLLAEIIVPNFRPVNLHLYTEREKDQMQRVVSSMIDYNLNYIQERTVEGSYVFNLDPNIEEIIKFPNSKTKRVMSYSNKQLISREIDLEKMRRLESLKIRNVSCVNNSSTSTKSSIPIGKIINEKSPQEQKLPNHLQRLQPRKVRNIGDIVNKDFFGRVIPKAAIDDQVSQECTNDIWYKYKEGFTNAVKKPIKISSLL